MNSINSRWLYSAKELNITLYPCCSTPNEQLVPHHSGAFSSLTATCLPRHWVETESEAIRPVTTNRCCVPITRHLSIWSQSPHKSGCNRDITWVMTHSQLTALTVSFLFFFWWVRERLLPVKNVLAALVNIACVIQWRYSSTIYGVWTNSLKQWQERGGHLKKKKKILYMQKYWRLTS